MMASAGHTYGPSCLLHAESNAFTRRASEVSIDPPPMRPQYFYCSTLPIDDPLSPVPPPTSGSTKPSKVPPRPFSIHDNRALEQAWLSIYKPDLPKGRVSKWLETAHEKGHSAGDASSKNLDNEAKVSKSAHEKKRTRTDKVEDLTVSSEGALSVAPIVDTASPEQLTQQPIQPSVIEQDSCDDADHAIVSQVLTKLMPIGGPDLTLSDDPEHIPFDETMPVGSDEIGNDEFESGLKKKRSFSPFRRKERAERKRQEKEEAATNRRLSRASQKTQNVQQLGSSPSERDTTGTPFLRVPSRKKKGGSRSPSPSPGSEIATNDGTEAVVDGVADSLSPSKPRFQRLKSDKGRDSSRERSEGPLFRSKPKKTQEYRVLVGISRLHVVEIPSLKVSSHLG